MSDAIKQITGDIFFLQVGITLVLPFSWIMPPNCPKLNALIARFMESYSSVSTSH